MLLIGGFQKLSLIDYPGKVAAVVFTQGCNFRCPFCHNRELVIPQEFKSPVPEEGVISFLTERRDKLQGLVVTGGEPTVQPDLIPFLRKVKALGLLVKLDTNGSYPDVIQEIIAEKLVDFFAVDIKAPWEHYARLTGIAAPVEDIRQGVRLILESGVEYMFRTTVVKPLLSPEDMAAISQMMANARHYVLQEFIPRPSVLDTSLLDQRHFTETEFKDLQQRWERRP